MEVSGGGLQGDYVAQQFHFHWGAVDSRGSEHAVNGRHFPMEVRYFGCNQPHSALIMW